jgi:tetratricopeptide (TPR) repeat protein
MFRYRIDRACFGAESMKTKEWRTFAGAVILSATVSALASMTAPALAETLTDRKCTGNPDIPRDEQIVGCTNAIASGSYTGKDFFAAFINRGNAYQASGDIDRAIADYDQAIRLDPNSARAFNIRGSAFFFKKVYDRAIADCAEAIRLDPKFVFAFNNRGNAYVAIGDFDRAITDYDQAIRLDPNAAYTFSGRGNAYKAKGDPDRAISDFDQAIRLDPKYVFAFNNRATA